MALPFQHEEGLLKGFRFCQDIIRVVGGNGKDTDPAFCQLGGERGKDPGQGEIQNTLYPKRPPTGFMTEGILRHAARRANQRNFLVGFAEKQELLLQIYLRKIFYLTDRELSGDDF